MPDGTVLDLGLASRTCSGGVSPPTSASAVALIHDENEAGHQGRYDIELANCLAIENANELHMCSNMLVNDDDDNHRDDNPIRNRLVRRAVYRLVDAAYNIGARRPTCPSYRRNLDRLADRYSGGHHPGKRARFSL